MAATAGTVAGRPQPQTTAEPPGGPFVRHAPDGRRAMYVAASAAQGTQNAQFIANPMVSSPGWNKGYRIQTQFTNGVATTTPIVAAADAPWNYYQLIQMKDAFGTQLLTGPGFDIAYLVQLYGAQFGMDDTRSPQNLPSFAPINLALSGSGNTTFSTYLAFEFAKAYGVISGANAALLPVLQINTSPFSSLISSGNQTTFPTSTTTVDSDFYWLPNVPSEPPGIGTTQQWIYQPCSNTIPTSGSQLVQLPRLGGYITGIIFDLRDATGARLADGGNTPNGTVGWPQRPKILVDGVPLIDSLFTTMCDDLAISTGVGAWSANATSSATGAPGGTVTNSRPAGTWYLNRKTALSQTDHGLLDTGEIFLSTNPGTQIEVAGYPWGTVSSGPMTLNAIAGQVVPTGALVRGLPEA